MQKSTLQLILEAIAVGALLYPVYLLTKYVLLPNILPFQVTNIYIILFVTGFLFHIICEITGINLLYVKNYNSILNQIEQQSDNPILQIVNRNK
jgi:hypothetical protein